MTSEGLGEMFEGDSADTCAKKNSLVSIGGRVEGLACADPGERTPICASGNFIVYFRSQLIMEQLMSESQKVGNVLSGLHPIVHEEVQSSSTQAGEQKSTSTSL